MRLKTEYLTEENMLLLLLTKVYYLYIWKQITEILIPRVI